MTNVCSEENREAILRRYAERTVRSRTAHERASRLLPAGVNRNIVYHGPHPLFIDRGRDAYLIDLDGNEYLDLIANYTSMILGNSAPEVASAARRQLDYGTAWVGASVAEADLAELIVERLPSAKRVRFTTSGTEASMMAIRAARAFTGRPLMAKFEGGYHGQHDYAMVSLAPDLAVAGPASHPRAVAPAGIPDGARDSMIILPFNDPAACEAILTEHGADLAGVIVEPVMGVAGTVLPADGFLRHLRDVTRRLGALLIFDEVITFRLGYGGAQALFGVTPDLTVLGKIIGGGYPIGAVAGAGEVMELFNPVRPGAITLSGTFQANPVTLAAGIAAMKRLTPEALEELNALGARLVARLRPLLGQARIPLQVNAIGSLLNLHATAEPVTDHRSSARGDREFLKWLHLALLNEGVLLSPRGMACLSLAMTEADLAHFLAAFRKALQATGAWARDAVDA